MPIYAYRCEECGFAKDVLQKISDAPLNDCPTCGKPSFRKQVTAAGFQLKGSGWYVTDFRGGSGGAGGASGPSAASASAAAGPASDGGSAAASSAGGTSGTSTTSTTSGGASANTASDSKAA